MMKVLPGKEFWVISRASKQIKEQLVEIDGKPFIYLFAGPYDVIACVKAEDTAQLKKIIDEVRKIKGVVETTTHVAMES